jgi:hypothetical protein
MSSSRSGIRRKIHALPTLRFEDQQLKQTLPSMQIEVRMDRIIQRAGRHNRPQGRLTLSMSANATLQDKLLQYLDQLDKAA